MTLRLPPMQALRAFEAAARERSLTKAASALHLTHGAISHQIKALEDDLGVRLFERAGRGIRLTDEGERFAVRVRAAFGELSAGVQEIAERSNPRRIRVSVTPSFAARWLLPRIGRFTAAHPDKAAKFAEIDTNKDGFIDAAEHKAHAGTKGAEGKCGEGKCGEGKCGGAKKTGDTK